MKIVESGVQLVEEDHWGCGWGYLVPVSLSLTLSLSLCSSWTLSFLATKSRAAVLCWVLSVCTERTEYPASPLP
jgi:hypothetical protein